MKRGLIIFIVVIVIIGIALTISYYKGWIGNYVHTVGDGEPVNDYLGCGDSTSRVDCTKPLYNPTEGSSQISYVMQSEEYPFPICMNSIKDKTGKQWFLNYVSGLKCVYIDDTSSPNFQPLSSDEQKFWDVAFKNAIKVILSYNPSAQYKQSICNCRWGYNEYDMAKAVKKRNEDITSIYWKRQLLSQVSDFTGQSSKKLQNLIVCDVHNFYNC